MNIRHIFLLTFLLALILGCSPKPKKKEIGKAQDPTEEGYSLIFFTLDNYALVYVDDSLIFDTRKVKADVKDEILVDLNPYISRSDAEIKVEGYNTECNSCQVNNYEFVYEIYRDGEGIEYISEYSNHKHQPVGLRMTKLHPLDEI